MKLIVKLFGVFIVLAGLILLVKPAIILDWIEINKNSNTLYISAILARFIFGILFIVLAKESRYPVAFKVLGYLFILAALSFVIIGKDAFQNFIASLIPHVSPYAILSGVVAMAFGVFILYAFTKKDVKI